MAATVVYDDVTEDADITTGTLFTGCKFWVAQRVPSRRSYVDKITTNGGQVVPLEKNADWLIADHFRRNINPPGSISYEFIDKSIARGELLDPLNFPAGPALGTARDPGSLVRPAKETRAAYTPEEDRQLYEWARYAKARGVAVSGNELYKQLELKNPRHTWQSWRDRYLKKLQYMPPSDFNVPENAPPSAPSDHAAEVVVKTGLVKNKDRAKTSGEPVVMAANRPHEPSVQPPRPGLVKNKDKARAANSTTDNETYTVAQLTSTFSTEDWEELYAFVEVIHSAAADPEEYKMSWTNLAGSNDNQTAEQWRQYYEKVVRPQWLRDPVSKREKIRSKVAARHEDVQSSPVMSQSWNQAQEGVASQDAEAPVKRTRDEDQSENEIPEPASESRPAKIRRKSNMSLSPDLEEVEHVNGTQEQPLELSSAAVSQHPQLERSQSEITTPTTRTQVAVIDLSGDISSETSEDEEPQSPPRPHANLETEETEENSDDLESTASSTDLTHFAPLPRPPKIPEDSPESSNNPNDSHSDLPPNTPTPRASKFTTFDTQAILSPSPSHITISRLPRPPLDSSPPHHPDSEASTTQSLQEFSSYLNNTNGDDLLTQQATPTQPVRHASPTPSTISTTSSTSTDPDPPLPAPQIDPFFTLQKTLGSTSPQISSALKRTRFRPRLAASVLEAWRRGVETPVKRGVWSEEEDAVLLAEDGLAREELGDQHTMGGWGGVVERENFLRAWGVR